MKTTLSAETAALITARLQSSVPLVPPANSPDLRQPVHTVYGGAHLFKRDSIAKLGGIAIRSFNANINDAADLAELFDIDPRFAGPVHTRISEKLVREPIEELRIDFEDGYGTRSDSEEDAHAVAGAVEMAAALEAGALSPFSGIRIKSFSPEARRRAVRTLDLFLTELAGRTNGVLPPNFVVTLPKVESAAEVSALSDLLDQLESGLGIAGRSVRLEIMIETPAAIVGHDGRMVMRSIADAARGRCRGAHFGAYDYTASLGITSKYQDLLNPACDLARGLMQLSLAGSGVWLSDGATNVMPIGPNRGENLTADQISENRETVRRGWRLHFKHCRNSLANGFYQGWDLHPAQLPSRYAALYTMFMEEVEPAGRRLRAFVEKAAQASLVGDQFDDAATGQGLLNFFIRGVNCGALRADEAAEHSGLSPEQLRSASFAQITGLAEQAQQ